MPFRYIKFFAASSCIYNWYYSEN